jgi:RNA polymerase sigma-70 factor (ECF subfamily)
LVLEDRLLVSRFKRGSSDAFCRIYEKYRDDLLKLAVSLLNETGVAEDIVHDVFASFIRAISDFQLTGSLKSYLATCVANRARNANRTSRQPRLLLDRAGSMPSNSIRPEQWITLSDELRQLSDALAQLPYSQREVITLHLQGGMKFRQIAEYQDVSIKTAQSRYRCGLGKLRSLLDSKVAR